MLTKGTDQKARDLVGHELEELNDKLRILGEDRTRDARSLRGARHDATDAEQQEGRALTTEAFAKRLGKIVPNLHVFRHPYHENKACFGVTLAGKDILHISTTEFPRIPEWSVFEVQKEWFPAISPKKLYSRDGVPIEHFTPDIPVRVEREAGVFEVARGWRTVLARFISQGFASLELVEKEFGVGDRASWASTLKLAKYDAADKPL